MAIHFDIPQNLPPLFPRTTPVVPVDSLVAVGTVTLTAADVPRGILRQFYTQILGLTCASAEPDLLIFTHQARFIRLDRNHPAPGHLGLLIRNFGEALLRLRDKRVPHELLHSDAGLSRTAHLRDPAGNWIHLLETRPF